MCEYFLGKNIRQTSPAPAPATAAMQTLTLLIAGKDGFDNVNPDEVDYLLRKPFRMLSNARNQFYSD